MDGKAVDFNSDKACQYDYIRKHFVDDNSELINVFGPIAITRYEDEAETDEEKKTRDELLKKEKALIQKGYHRVLEKIRQHFNDTIAHGGLSSGSPKVVLDNYELLLQIYGGSALVKPLHFGVSTGDELPGEDAPSPSEESNDQDGDGSADVSSGNEENTTEAIGNGAPKREHGNNSID